MSLNDIFDKKNRKAGIFIKTFQEEEHLIKLPFFYLSKSKPNENLPLTL
jgi:hypothetical protein